MDDRHEVPGHGEVRFAVLPDHEAALAVAPALAASRTVAHPSGRPWLVGDWPDDAVTVAAAGDVRIAVIGDHRPADARRLAGEAARFGGPAAFGAAAGTALDTALDRLARTLPGSFHLAAACDGRTRVQGTASGLRLVFHARVGDITVAADRADALAALTGASLDERRLAVRLLWPVPHPLAHAPLWRGVHGVEPGHRLTIEPDGRGTRVHRWWTPPRPDRPLAAAAADVRDALADAVAARTAAGGTVSCDLSGGLDSTSLCFLAARGDAALIASTWPGRDPADDDLAWARRAAAHLPDVEHAVWPAERSPLVYADLLEADDPFDEPTIGVMDRARVLSHLPMLRAKGSRLHLTGIGGDQVAWCSEAYYHRLLRRRPLFALQRLRGFRALFQWPLAPTAAALADRRPYRRWLADAAADLHGPWPASATGALGWDTPPRLFDWVTADAAHAARDAVATAARTARPLAPDRGTHADLAGVHACTRIVRQWDALSARAGLPAASPFLDDRVIEACFAVRPADRVTPWRYKPLLVAAMRGVVPDACLARTSKAEAALDAAEGLRAHRDDLAALWDGSRLADLGLVDADRLRDLAARPATPELRDGILYPTIACEVWLRGLDRARTPARRGPLTTEGH